MSKPHSEKWTPVHYVATFTALVKGVNGLLQTVLLALKPSKAQILKGGKTLLTRETFQGYNCPLYIFRTLG